MPRIKSEIVYEEFAVLAEKCGLLKEAYPSLQAYEDDPEARVGSDDISTIEALYGVKPDTIEGLEYEHNIMEAAHSRSVIIAPSYDKINGLVENNIERSNIMKNIALKPNSATHTNPKYAHQELTFELVRLGNEMDARNQAELYKLADECLIDLQKEAGFWDKVKEYFGADTADVAKSTLIGAGIGAALGALALCWSGPGAAVGATEGATIGGRLGAAFAAGALRSAALRGAITLGAGTAAITAFTKTEEEVKNVKMNGDSLLNELKDLEKQMPQDQDFFNLIKKSVNDLIISSNNYLSVLHTLRGSNADPAMGKADIEAVTTKFQQALRDVQKGHQEFDKRAEEGEFASVKSSVTPVYWFVLDDIQEVQKAFNVLEQAANNIMSASIAASNTVAQGVVEASKNKDVQPQQPKGNVSPEPSAKQSTPPAPEVKNPEPAPAPSLPQPTSNTGEHFSMKDVQDLFNQIDKNPTEEINKLRNK